jgi:hypothetical protein
MVGCLLGDVVKSVANPLTDLVDRPPGDFLHLERVGMQDTLRRRNQAVDGDVAIGDPLILFELIELDVQTD